MLFLIGGSSDFTGSSGKTLFFHVAENRWISGPELNVARRYHSCGIMNWKNPKSNSVEQVVVAAGGQTVRRFSGDQLGLQLSSVEQLFVEDLKSGWTIGPDLPFNISTAAIVEFEDGLVLVGGFGAEVDGRHLYRLSTPDGTWTEMEQTLKEEYRRGQVAFLIPDELTNCH